jgi:hypothetical protein
MATLTTHAMAITIITKRGSSAAIKRGSESWGRIPGRSFTVCSVGKSKGQLGLREREFMLRKKYFYHVVISRLFNDVSFDILNSGKSYIFARTFKFMSKGQQTCHTYIQ